MARKFIRGAIKHPGSLTRYAKQHRLLRPDGTIDLSRAKDYAERHHDLRRVRQVNLANTLRRLRA